jgi:pimeloyl-ACP methyl ester carboxylesterase
MRKRTRIGLAAAIVLSGLWIALAPLGSICTTTASRASRRAGPIFGVDEANDIVAAIDVLKRRDPARQIGGIGHSMGGETLLYAAARDACLEAVVVDSAYSDTRSITSVPAARLPAAFRTRFGTHAAPYRIVPKAYTEAVVDVFDRRFAPAACRAAGPGTPPRHGRRRWTES